MSTSVLSSVPVDAEPLALPPAETAKLRLLVDRHFSFVWRCLRRAGIPEADTDDAVQRVFLTAARRLADIRTGAERSFLFAVARGEAGHLRRSYRRRGEVGPEAMLDKSTGALRPDEVAGRQQALSFVSTVLEQMEEDLRTVFVLCEVEELSSVEVAEALSIPVGTVKSRLRRAREDFAARTQVLRTGGIRS
jgi:RNA polymerase sigma-70 factor (ECF subfamily)